MKEDKVKQTSKLIHNMEMIHLMRFKSWD